MSDIKCTFLYLKFLFEYSKNNKHDKDMLNVLFNRIVIRRNLRKKINHITNNFNLYIGVIDEFLGNEFINNLIIFISYNIEIQ